jgi:hypothetical protein
MDLSDYASVFTLDLLMRMEQTFESNTPNLFECIWAHNTTYGLDVQRRMRSSMMEGPLGHYKRKHFMTSIAELNTDIAMHPEVQGPFWPLFLLHIAGQSNLTMDEFSALTNVMKSLLLVPTLLQRFRRECPDDAEHYRLAYQAFDVLCHDPWDFLVAGFAPDLVDEGLKREIDYYASDAIVSLLSTILFKYGSEFDVPGWT